MVSILLANPFWTWVQRLGGPGLILLGIVDNSVVPMPGGMDVMVILLSAHHREWWLFYAFMATIGAVVGGFLTYRLGKKGGEETLEKKIGKARAKKVYTRFRTHGFPTIVIGAVLPPPFPMVPLLVAAGALHYPRKKFVAALALGRALRFVAVAFLAHVYGKSILGWLSKYYKPLLYILVALAVLGALGALIYFKWYRPRHQQG
jgi:membrane protein YqaA with SNARE-associated domain